MNIALLTNEYPPHIYGGAGVHVEYLTRELAALSRGRHHVDVLSFGDQREEHPGLSVRGFEPACAIDVQDPRHTRFMSTLVQNLMMAGSVREAAIAHCHTWYAHFGGLLLQQLVGAKLVLTTHSLEPHRPWKVEQLGTAYNATTWVERTAYENADGVVAVSESMRQDVHDLYGVPFERIRVIPNGIDLNEYRPTPDDAVLRRYGVDPAVPYLLFVGRITRQKGIIHLVRALQHLQPGIQVVLCAGAPDTQEIGEEMTQAVEAARRQSANPIVWINQMAPRADVISLYSGAAVFVCPSVYEPFGIINLEAMACETPVVASAVGGIPEIVVHGETGYLVPFERRGDTDFEPVDPAAFARDLAARINEVMADPDLQRRMGLASRARVEAEFSWTRIAERTLEFYEALTAADPR